MTPSVKLKQIITVGLIFLVNATGTGQTLTYPVVETGVHLFYDNTSVISPPASGAAFYGQDATYQGNEPSYTDNGDGTITDNITGLMWQQADDGISRDWEHSLAYAENLSLANHADWRLPNAKELHTIVDYNRCPGYTSSPAIDQMFATTMILDPDGNPGQYPYFWSGTGHLDGQNPYSSAVYIAFGKAQGKMNGNLMDVVGLPGAYMCCMF